MGCSKKKHQLEVRKDSENKKWVIAGISMRTPLKPISTKTTKAVEGCCEDENNGACSTTPKARESKIPEIVTCPPAPRKRRPSSTCHFNGVVEFFNPPDLESVFIYRAERAKY